MSEVLEEIRAKHWGRPGLGREYCTICGGETPCDVVSLAEALEGFLSHGDGKEQRDVARRTLHKVAGMEEK